MSGQLSSAQQPLNLVSSKPEDGDDGNDLVFLGEVYNNHMQHNPEDYYTECKCRTCALAKKLLADCFCEECDPLGEKRQSQANNGIRVEGQVEQSSANAADANETA